MYIEFRAAVSRRKAQKVADDPTAHCEPRRGTRDEARAYCCDRTKKTSGPVVEEGNWDEGGQGARSDLKKVVETVKKTTSGAILACAENHPCEFIKYNNGIAKLDFLLNKGPVWRDITTYVYYGKPGVGKSKMARQFHDTKDGRVGGYYGLNTDRKELWYDGYQGESTLIVDDIDQTMVTLATVKKITDGHQYMIPIKNGFTWAKWTTVIITSEQHPREWWGGVPAEDGLWRRLTHIKEILRAVP